MLDNYAIADNFSLLAKLIDIHGENSFKSKSYANAAFVIEKLPEQLSQLPTNKIFSIKGIGEAIGTKIQEQLNTGILQILQEYIQKTPPGIIEMLHIKGLGQKKINCIWKQLEIESIGELLYACNENRLTLLKGFGAKTQESIKENINYYLNNLGNFLYQQVESYIQAYLQKLTGLFPDALFEITGEFKRQLETIDSVEWVTTVNAEALKQFFILNKYLIEVDTPKKLVLKGSENIKLIFHFISKQQFSYYTFITSCSNEFLEAWKQQFTWKEDTHYKNEIEVFETVGMEVIPACRREFPEIIEQYKEKKIAPPLQINDIKGIIHSHSNWSDGQHTLEQMAIAAKEKGYEYLVISDHSKSAFYANGLQEERIFAQHAAIDALNKNLAPFKIFKSIESDILNDGSLDYADDILQLFDIVIASVHSNLKMTEEKAMSRLLKAIENPYTSILGHLTGRLLLSRKGYPVNHDSIIEACAKHQVAIELNAHPRRLDIDWRYIPSALQKNVLISIDPDAHAIEGFDDCKYGVLVAQKTGLTKFQNLSSFSLEQFEFFIVQQHKKRKN
ncbi:DNA polymerase/3'-5' exonuclease PolX [Hydrotalea sp.]|uniref:DNA polymerase/3'-5' exonuclease PolX n=1 Tax=Hydrotalea sp. TaxID=2881279 RepID=UPI00261A2011|nr:DNA polymerase/3'-5' exonuclease PolX [Hydrotalea sp.]